MIVAFLCRAVLKDLHKAMSESILCTQHNYIYIYNMTCYEKKGHLANILDMPFLVYTVS